MRHKWLTHIVAAAWLVIAIPAGKSQIRYGSREPVPADLVQQIAAAQAQFSSVLANGPLRSAARVAAFAVASVRHVAAPAGRARQRWRRCECDSGHLCGARSSPR